MVRTGLQKRVGGYRPELPHSGDLEMWLRLAAHASVGYVHCDQAVYRRHATNMSLEYGKSNALRDLQQRKAAFDCFLDACAEQRPELVQVHEELLRALARGAIGMASEAFNDNCRDLCERIEAFAVGLDPRVTQAPAWKRLALKKRLGWRVSRALLAAMSAMRVRPAPWIQGARSRKRSRDLDRRPSAGAGAPDVGAHPLHDRYPGPRRSRLDRQDHRFGFPSNAFAGAVDHRRRRLDRRHRSAPRQSGQAAVRLTVIHRDNRGYRAGRSGVDGRLYAGFAQIEHEPWSM